MQRDVGRASNPVLWFPEQKYLTHTERNLSWLVQGQWAVTGGWDELLSPCFTGSPVGTKALQCWGEGPSEVIPELGDNLPIEERCAVNLIISQRTVIFPRAGIFKPLNNTNYCYHSSNWSNQSGVWNIKLEYIIPKGIILAKFTPTDTASASPSPARGSHRLLCLSLTVPSLHSPCPPS